MTAACVVVYNSINAFSTLLAQPLSADICIFPMTAAQKTQETSPALLILRHRQHRPPHVRAQLHLLHLPHRLSAIPPRRQRTTTVMSCSYVNVVSPGAPRATHAHHSDSTCLHPSLASTSAARRAIWTNRRYGFLLTPTTGCASKMAQPFSTPVSIAPFARRPRLPRTCSTSTESSALRSARPTSTVIGSS